MPLRYASLRSSTGRLLLGARGPNEGEYRHIMARGVLAAGSRGEAGKAAATSVNLPGTDAEL